MKKIVLVLLLSLIANASILDFKTINEAKKAYERGDFLKAAKLYDKIDNDRAKFNAADAYYRAKRYKDALRLLKSIHSKDLKFKKLYNMGNCYAKLRDFDNAIKAYKEALNIKKDKDAEFNLKLVEELKNKKQHKNSKQNKSNKNSKQNQKKSNQNKNSSQNKKGNQNKNQTQNKNHSQNKKSNQNKKDNQKDKEQNKKNQPKQNAKNKPNEKNKKQQKNSLQEQHIKIKKEPISDMEIRKWNRVLERRAVNTLLLPLKTKGEPDEKNPW